MPNISSLDLKEAERTSISPSEKSLKSDAITNKEDTRRDALFVYISQAMGLTNHLNLK